MIALVDCNNFYASCERVFRPDLEGKPVAVLSNNDGCIIARSQEVKALGVPMGAPMFKWKQSIQEQGISVFSPNFSLYGDMSDRVMSVLRDHCPYVEVYSIDEAFLDLTLIPRDQLGAYCRELKAVVQQWTGIPVSIGVAPSKTLAKLANNIAKKNPSSKGCWLLMGSEQQRMSHIDIGDVWGVGRRLTQRLNGYGIHTAWDLRTMDTVLARKLASVNIERTIRELNGEACLPFDTAQSPRQRILVSRSFGHDVTSYESLQAAIVTYAARAGEKLRRQKSRTQSISVFIHTNPYKDDLPQYKGSVNVPLDLPTSDPLQLSRAAMLGLKHIYKPGYHYKRGGVLLDQVLPEHIAQLSLFTKEVGQSQLGSVVDAINQKMGAGSIQFSSGYVGSDWRMKQNLRSPRYTTRWGDLRTVA